MQYKIVCKFIGPYRSYCIRDYTPHSSICDYVSKHEQITSFFIVRKSYKIIYFIYVNTQLHIVCHWITYQLHEPCYCNTGKCSSTLCIKTYYFVHWRKNINSLAPERYGCNLKTVIFKLISRKDVLSISSENALWWMHKASLMINQYNYR